jgi:hypothetical protein
MESQGTMGASQPGSDLWMVSGLGAFQSWGKLPPAGFPRRFLALLVWLAPRMGATILSEPAGGFTPNRNAPPERPRLPEDRAFGGAARLFRVNEAPPLWVHFNDLSLPPTEPTEIAPAMNLQSHCNLRPRFLWYTYATSPAGNFGSQKYIAPRGRHHRGCGTGWRSTPCSSIMT